MKQRDAWFVTMWHVRCRTHVFGECYDVVREWTQCSEHCSSIPWTFRVSPTFNHLNSQYMKSSSASIFPNNILAHHPWL